VSYRPVCRGPAGQPHHSGQGRRPPGRV